MEPHNREPAKNFKAYADCPKKKVYIDGIGMVEMITTFECEQDMHAMLKAMFKRRAPEFTAQEILDWREAWKQIKDYTKYDFEEIKRKYKVQFIREEETRMGDEDDEVSMQGWVGDIFDDLAKDYYV